VSDRLRVALTIDTEHPDRREWASDEPRLLETLASEQVRATFFVQGRWASANPDTVARMAADAHLIGNHSFFHARLPMLTDDGIRKDVMAAEEAITAAAGCSPRPWFRCPWGDGHDDPRVLAAIAEVGYRDHSWDVDPYDFDPQRTERELVERVTAGVERHGDGVVVLLHSWPAVTPRALPTLIDRLRGVGAEFVGLDEVVGA
jgi:peptidoglycan/xylan/chitin deacetylase (PgdA/CDA1 family)